MLRSSAQGVDPPVCRVLDVAGKMLRSSAQGVDPPVCRVLDVAATHARVLSFQEGHLSSREGGGGGGADRLASGLQWFEDDFVESGTGRFANIQVLGMAQYLYYIFCVSNDNWLIKLTFDIFLS